MERFLGVDKCLPETQRQQLLRKAYFFFFKSPASSLLSHKGAYTREHGAGLGSQGS